jgi:hypothetical protein
MQTTLMKEKPDLLFNNPLKQKVYVFLKNNPGKTFELFQVLTSDPTVSRQHFTEVEQAIRAREERNQPREVPKEINALFLTGNPIEKFSATTEQNYFNQSTEKEFPLKKFEKKKMNERAKQFITANPECSYTELVEKLNFKDLTKPHFFAMKTQLRKKGLISAESRVRRGRKPGVQSTSSAKTFTSAPTRSNANSKTIEILESIDATDFSNELREHYKSHVLPLLQRLIPNGNRLQLVMLSDPPMIELRRGVQ